MKLPKTKTFKLERFEPPSRSTEAPTPVHWMTTLRPNTNQTAVKQSSIRTAPTRNETKTEKHPEQQKKKEKHPKKTGQRAGGGGSKAHTVGEW